LENRSLLLSKWILLFGMEVILGEFEERADALTPAF